MSFKLIYSKSNLKVKQCSTTCKSSGEIKQYKINKKGCVAQKVIIINGIPVAVGMKEKKGKVKCIKEKKKKKKAFYDLTKEDISRIKKSNSIKKLPIKETKNEIANMVNKIFNNKETDYKKEDEEIKKEKENEKSTTPVEPNPVKPVEPKPIEPVNTIEIKGEEFKKVDNDKNKKDIIAEIKKDDSGLDKDSTPKPTHKPDEKKKIDLAEKEKELDDYINGCIANDKFININSNEVKKYLNILKNTTQKIVYNNITILDNKLCNLYKDKNIGPIFTNNDKGTISSYGDEINILKSVRKKLIEKEILKDDKITNLSTVEEVDDLKKNEDFRSLKSKIDIILNFLDNTKKDGKPDNNYRISMLSNVFNISTNCCLIYTLLNQKKPNSEELLQNTLSAALLGRRVDLHRHDDDNNDDDNDNYDYEVETEAEKEARLKKEEAAKKAAEEAQKEEQERIERLLGEFFQNINSKIENFKKEGLKITELNKTANILASLIEEKKCFNTLTSKLLQDFIGDIKKLVSNDDKNKDESFNALKENYLKDSEVNEKKYEYIKYTINKFCDFYSGIFNVDISKSKKNYAEYFCKNKLCKGDKYLEDEKIVDFFNDILGDNTLQKQKGTNNKNFLQNALSIAIQNRRNNMKQYDDGDDENDDDDDWNSYD